MNLGIHQRKLWMSGTYNLPQIYTLKNTNKHYLLTLKSQHLPLRGSGLNHCAQLYVKVLYYGNI